MAHLKTRFGTTGFRALTAGTMACALAIFSGCASRVVRHPRGEVVGEASASSVVFEGEGVLAARGGDEPLTSNWRDASLSIRPVESQWEEAMWPTQRRNGLGRYRRFTLPRTAETVIYFPEAPTWHHRGSYDWRW